MIHKELFDKVLIEPALKCPGGKLRIVSGYATASMVDMHMEKLRDIDTDISIELIVGMASRGGLNITQHLAIQKLEIECPWGIDFQCGYVVADKPAVHAKSYLWLDSNDTPIQAFCGSANYTVQGFVSKQIELLTKTAPSKSNRFHDFIHNQSISCNQFNVNALVKLVKNRSGNYGNITKRSLSKNKIKKLESINLTLLKSKSEETPSKSGINWGHRDSRNRNESYINIPVDIGRGDFFPDRGQPFVVHTDDGSILICVRAQDSGKAIETTHDNSILGSYLRNRLGVKSEKYVTAQDLINYGRTDVTIYKKDLESYYLDFSV